MADRCMDAFRKNQGLRFETDGERQLDANSVIECKRSCLARGKCYGFDWFEGNPDGNKCFLQFKFDGNTRSDADAVYYQIGIPGSGCRGTYTVTHAYIVLLWSHPKNQKSAVLSNSEMKISKWSYFQNHANRSQRANRFEIACNISLKREISRKTPAWLHHRPSNPVWSQRQLVFRWIRSIEHSNIRFLQARNWKIGKDQIFSDLACSVHSHYTMHLHRVNRYRHSPTNIIHSKVHYDGDLRPKPRTSSLCLSFFTLEPTTPLTIESQRLKRRLHLVPLNNIFSEIISFRKWSLSQYLCLY